MSVRRRQDMFSKHLPKTFSKRLCKKSSKCLQEVLEDKKLLRRRRLQEEILQRCTIMQFLATREVNVSLAKVNQSLASFRNCSFFIMKTIW